jgi:Uma2 family endonuclease
MSQSAIVGTWSAPRMTLAEWADLPEDEPGELVDGHLEEDEVAGPVHETLASALNALLRNWAVPPGGLVLGSFAKYAVRPPNRGRMPDVSAFLPGSRKPSRAALIPLPPDIAVEIVSATPRDGRRDRVEKLKEYAAFGVRWYWLVDPALRSVEILELGADGRYVHALDATDGVVDVPGCSGLRIDLDALWAEIDQLGPDEPAPEN